ncbi:MAG: hypothetical protein JWR38_1144 [Mucilaginibacter sp.]|nr:hypothetical protein [Mucilaginibacter sp.]
MRCFHNILTMKKVNEKNWRNNIKCNYIYIINI